MVASVTAIGTINTTRAIGYAVAKLSQALVFTKMIVAVITTIEKHSGAIIVTLLSFTSELKGKLMVDLYLIDSPDIAALRHLRRDSILKSKEIREASSQN